MSHCLCSICNNIELWERDKPHHLSAQISNQLAEIKAHEGTWWACLCKSTPPPPEVSLVWMNISGDNERAGQRVTGLLEWFALISIISTVSIKPSPVFSSKGAHRTPEGRSAERCHLCNKKTDLPRLTPLNCSLLSRCQYHCPAPSLKCEEEQQGGRYFSRTWYLKTNVK